MNNKRKVKYNNGEWQNFWIEGERNPCNCGSNIFHKELANDKVVGVCNACGRDIYVFDYTEKEIKEMEWVEK